MFKNEGWYLTRQYTDYSSYLKLLSSLSEPDFTQDYHIPELLVFPPGTSFFQHQSYINGEILLQDKASCLPSYLLNPPSGSVILDMCAAPGMKTSHLAAKLQNEGNIYAVEMEKGRYQMLCEQLAQTNAYCVCTINEDAMSLGPDQIPGVEYILVDPSCSGSGMVDRPKLGKKDDKYESERLKSLQAFQVFLLRHALLNFPSVKKVVYSTCSIHREENEDVIDEILTNIGNAYKLVSIKKFLKNDWINYCAEDSGCKKKCIYARPEVDLCNGFFIAMFKRKFDVPLPTYIPRTYNTYKETELTSRKEKQSCQKDEDKNVNKTSSKKKKRRKKKKRVDNDAEEKEDNEKNIETVLEEPTRKKFKI